MKRAMTFDESELNMIQDALRVYLGTICKDVIDLERVPNDLRDMYLKGEVDAYTILCNGECELQTERAQRIIQEQVLPMSSLCMDVYSELYLSKEDCKQLDNEYALNRLQGVKRAI